MEPSEFIEAAIRRGEANGLELLDHLEKVVFAISEAEVYCDKDGIDALIDRYGVEHMQVFANAFLEVGANEIATAMQAVASSALPIPGHLLSSLNRLVTERRGYSYESIESFVRRGA